MLVDDILTLHESFGVLPLLVDAIRVAELLDRLSEENLSCCEKNGDLGPPEDEPPNSDCCLLGFGLLRDDDSSDIFDSCLLK